MSTHDVAAGRCSLDHIVGICSSPGCGATAKIGRPCADYNCPQRYVTAEEYQKLEEKLSQLSRENEYLWNKHSSK